MLTHRHTAVFVSIASIAALLATGASAAESATFTVRQLAPGTALKAAQAAQARCRGDGFQVTVAVVDRGGSLQILLRDRFAGAHTIDTATNKAWTAVSFRTSTSELDKMTQGSSASVGVRNLPRVIAVGGGLLIESGGAILGGIGVSGAPGPPNDEACAKAGIAAIADSLEF